ncbi:MULTISPECIES: SpoIIE family protein phosphatase [Streptomyces]|uniref:protein-serine/threonine phosphatase n=3 Tax=Streptomyces TaxID=1883 RepID=A0ABD5JFZ8_9ACTN|nr:SpoIIE family protein phosphatase [Streptomyces violaceusniger]MEE4586578.1 SpoIIE family protein phosphatase [Streptomyces sp. DSM 41602]WTB11520.1 PAS domain-containing SpoIIE family protein phosphatase/ATP-binding protein [Streptomyces antimycoticus]
MMRHDSGSARKRGSFNEPDEPDETDTARATVSDDGTLTSWNDGARRLLGYPPPQVVGRPAAALLADPARAADAGARRARDRLTRWHGTVALRHQDGHEMPVRLLAHRSGPEGDWLLVAAAPRAELPPESWNDALMLWAYAQSPCPMAIYDADLRLRKVNSQMARVVGLPEAEIRDLRLSEIGGKLQSEQLEGVMRHVLTTGEPREVETCLRTGGESKEHAWSAAFTPLKAKDGQVYAVCMAAHDITEQYLARQRLLLLSAASERIGSTLDIDHTAQELADVCVPRLADYASIDLLDRLAQDDELPSGPLTGPVVLRRAALQSLYEGCPESVVPVGKVDTYPQVSPMAECLVVERPLIYATTDPMIAKWGALKPARARSIRRFGIHSVMAVPIRARGTTLGVAVFARHHTPEPFTQDDMVLAEEITTRAAVCVDNARRFTRERDTALALQRSLLPRTLPQPPAVEVASRYLPAGPFAGAGGDWFDVIPLSGARVALVVGDVVGHGIQASATMGRLRTAVRTLADVDLPPDELLTHLDDLVIHLAAETGAEESTGDVGATCLYAVYDPVSHRCSLAAAGHPPPALARPDDTVEFLPVPTGPPLGVGGLPFESMETELPENAVLALYTNGLMAGWNRGIDESRLLLTHALAHPGGSLDGACDAVLRTLLPDGGALDDVALLLARTRSLGEAHVATWDVPADPAWVARSRRDVTERLTEWGLDEAVFTTELVVSELVTNAIRHAVPPIRLRLIHDHSLICEVTDSSSTAPHMRRARTFDEGGRGLLLVARLSQRWGSRQTVEGKTIWSEQTLPVGLPTGLPGLD